MDGWMGGLGAMEGGGKGKEHTSAQVIARAVHIADIPTRRRFPGLKEDRNDK